MIALIIALFPLYNQYEIKRKEMMQMLANINKKSLIIMSSIAGVAVIAIVGILFAVGIFNSSAEEETEILTDMEILTNESEMFSEPVKEDASTQEIETEPVIGETTTETNAETTTKNTENKPADKPSESTTKKPVSTTAVTTQPSKPTNEQILNQYTLVMNKLKSEMKSYDKKEFQKLTDDRDLGTAGNIVLGIASGLMTSEDKAELQHRTDKEQIPVINNLKGCLLTDVSAIKSASMTEKNGKTTITITLKDEKNSSPAEAGAVASKSTVGAMFNPINAKDIDKIKQEFGSVATVNSMDMTYKNCTATLVFDSKTLEVESLNQVMNVYVDIDAKVLGINMSGYANIVNTLKINNVAY